MPILNHSNISLGSASRFAAASTPLEALNSISNRYGTRLGAERNEKLDLRNKFPRRGTFETISPVALVLVSVIDSKETA